MISRKGELMKSYQRLLNMLKEKRDSYRLLLSKGKGSWSKVGYITDATWYGWKHTEQILSSIIKYEEEKTNVLNP